MKIKGQLRPSGYKSKLGLLPSAYKIKGCKGKGSKLDLTMKGGVVSAKLDLLKNETEGSFYKLEEALDSAGDCWNHGR